MKYLKLFLVLAFLSINACGKVVQESTQKKEDPIFKLTFSIPVVTRNATINDISVEKNLYACVTSYEQDGKKKELSWGQGKTELKEVKVEGKPSLKTFTSKSLTKKGVEITAADHTWTKAELKTTPQKAEWAVESVELRRGSYGYLVAAYTDTSHYRLKWLSKTDVSGNVSVELKTLEPYDTFLTILRLMRIQDGDPRLSYEEKFTSLFNQSVFAALRYELPENKAPNFDPKKPAFVFDRLLEKTLISIWELYTVDPKEALGYLNEIKPDVLPNDAKQLLQKTIQETLSPKKS